MKKQDLYDGSMVYTNPALSMWSRHGLYEDNMAYMKAA